jgi:ResB-like family
LAEENNVSKKARRGAITAIRPAPKAAIIASEPKAKVAPSAKKLPLHRRILYIAASLKLTVVLLIVAMGLVFFGTLAQVGNGVWTVVDNYFRSFAVWVPLQIFVHPTVRIPAEFGFPYPGGWTIGFLLLTNLLAAHFLRFKLSWTKIGVWLIHIGLIVMMVGEFLTGVAAIEYRMIIEEGKSSSVLLDQRKMELAFVDVTDPNTDHIAAIAGSRLRQGRTISDPILPVDVEVLAYYANSDVKDVGPDDKNTATAGLGLRHLAVKKSEVSGVEVEQEMDSPSMYVRLIDKKTGKTKGDYLVSTLLKDQLLRIDGRDYELTLRYKQVPEPYTFHLLKFTHDKYPGTDTPKDYRSHVRIVDPSKNVDREVEIFMNAPLSYEGKTYYQSGFLPPNSGSRGTILQVVSNPGWFMPYLSCILVAAGMLFHFGLALFRFLVRTAQEGGATR